MPAATVASAKLVLLPANVATALLIAEAPAVEALSPLGSGDSLLGAFLVKYERSGSFEKALQFGVSAGVCNTMKLGSGFIDLSDVQALAETVVVTSWVK